MKQHKHQHRDPVSQTLHKRPLDSFTLIELITVLAIIGVIAMIALQNFDNSITAKLQTAAYEYRNCISLVRQYHIISKGMVRSKGILFPTWRNVSNDMAYRSYRPASVDEWWGAYYWMDQWHVLPPGVVFSTNRNVCFYKEVSLDNRGTLPYSKLPEVYGRLINQFYFEGQFGKTMTMAGANIYYVDTTDYTYMMPLTQGFFDCENRKLYCNQANAQTAMVRVCYHTGLVRLDLSDTLK